MGWLSRLFGGKPKGTTTNTGGASSVPKPSSAEAGAPTTPASPGCATCGRTDVKLTPCMSCKKLFCGNHGEHYAGMFACPDCLARARRDRMSRIGR